MTVENISWSISMKECCRPRRGLNPRPPGLQSDGASNWATEAGNSSSKYWYFFFFSSPWKHMLWYSLEVPHWDTSKWVTQHMFSWKNNMWIPHLSGAMRMIKKNTIITIICISDTDLYLINDLNLLALSRHIRQSTNWYFFLIFPTKIGSDIQANSSRQFAWNIKPYFCGEKNKTNSNIICWNFYWACYVLIYMDKQIKKWSQGLFI